MSLLLSPGAVGLLDHPAGPGRADPLVGEDFLVNCLGIDIYKVFTGVFALGVGLAGLAGALSVPMRGAQPLMGDTILTICFVVVVIGGMWSFAGAILGGLLVGVVESMMALVWPPGTMVSIFAAMALVILVRPKGLLGFK